MGYPLLNKLTKNELTVLEYIFEYGIDILNRRLYLIDEINNTTTELLIKGLHILDTSTGPIQIWINSPGGTESDMFALYDVIRSCTNEVITIGIGEICSAAGLLLVAGDKRYAAKNCSFMAHEGTFASDLESNLAIESRAAINSKRSKQWASIMAERTEPNEKWWVDNVIENKRELWLSAKQMKQQQYKIVNGMWPLE